MCLYIYILYIYIIIHRCVYNSHMRTMVLEYESQHLPLSKITQMMPVGARWKKQTNRWPCCRRTVVEDKTAPKNGNMSKDMEQMVISCGLMMNPHSYKLVYIVSCIWLCIYIYIYNQPCLNICLLDTDFADERSRTSAPHVVGSKPGVHPCLLIFRWDFGHKNTGNTGFVRVKSHV